MKVHGWYLANGKKWALNRLYAAVLLMTLKAGGVGLNLTKASYVFHLEPWWNPAVENQATDHVHRIGQKRAVQVYRYIMHESVEEKIERLKLQKQQRFDAMFTEDEVIAAGDSQIALAADAKGARDVSPTAEIARAGGSHLSQSDFQFLLS